MARKIISIRGSPPFVTTFAFNTTSLLKSGFNDLFGEDANLSLITQRLVPDKVGKAAGNLGKSAIAHKGFASRLRAFIDTLRGGIILGNFALLVLDLYGVIRAVDSFTVRYGEADLTGIAAVCGKVIIAGKEENAVPEVELTAMVCQFLIGGTASFIENCHKGLEYLRVSLVQLIKNKESVLIAGYFFKDGRIAVAYVAWRCSDESADGGFILEGITRAKHSVAFVDDTIDAESLPSIERWG